MPAVTPVGAGIYHGVTYHPAPWDMNALTQFETDAGAQTAIVSYFIGYAANNPPERSRLEAIRATTAVPMITWEWRQISRLTDITAGKYDGDLRLWARELKAFGGTVLLRWGHEMNGPWFPWSVGVNGNTSQDYVNSWNRMRSIFLAEDASNVQWVWSPNIKEGNAIDFRPMFPGSANVDWIGLDGYNWATLNPWRSFSDIFRDSYGLITSLTTKPLMIAEWGSTEAGGDKGAWLRSALSNEIPTAFPRVRAVIYFNQNYEEDWRIESSDRARLGYADGIRAGAYRTSWP